MIGVFIGITYLGYLLTLAGIVRDKFDWVIKGGLIVLSEGIIWWTLYSLRYLG